MASLIFYEILFTKLVLESFSFFVSLTLHVFWKNPYAAKLLYIQLRQHNKCDSYTSVTAHYDHKITLQHLSASSCFKQRKVKNIKHSPQQVELSREKDGKK